MKKVISYALWGTDSLYNEGIVANVLSVPEFYPGWVCRVYSSPTAPAYQTLLKMNCEVVPFTPTKNEEGQYSWTNLMWRYYPAAEPLDVVIFRDADSRLSDREVKAVDEWLVSGKALHVMHDDSAHYRYPICSGMWGVLGGWLPNIQKMADCWMENKLMTSVYDKEIAVDEVFLAEVVWPMFKYGNYLGHGIHESWNSFDPEATPLVPFGDNDRPFPSSSPMKIGNYIGQKIRLPAFRKKSPNFFFFKK